MENNKEVDPDWILNKYFQDKCPLCSEKVNSEFPIGHTESGGKCMAQYFQCQHCHSRYTIGFNRQPLLIKSEITVNNFKKNLDN